jgi:transcriptional regulator with XRE-family HTH domain
MAKRLVLGVPDPVDIQIGARLRAVRIERGVSQQKLANAVGVSLRQVQKYEKGMNRVSGAMLYGLARRLAVPISAFFDSLPDPALHDPTNRDGWR